MLMTLFFVLMLLWFFGKVVKLAFKMTWGIVKIIFAIVLFPLFLVLLIFAGLIYIALPVLLIAWIIACVCAPVRSA